MTLDLYKTLGESPVRADERFHWEIVKPEPHVWKFLFIRRTAWTGIFGPDRSPATFVSWAIGWGKKRLQWYHGTAKCDGSRTHALQGGLLGGTEEQQAGYVMTTTPKEMWACRLRDLAEQPSWDNMGGY